jgi:hypothetical protein
MQYQLPEFKRAICADAVESYGILLTRPYARDTFDHSCVSLIMLAVEPKDLTVAETQRQDARWQFIARALLNCQHSEGIGTTAPSRERCNASGSQGASVRLIEYLSDRTVLIEWSNSTGCRYGEQTWTRAYATAAGVCSLSGKPVARGDAIFRPHRQKNCASNALAMILATEINEARKTMLADEPI